MTLILHPEGNYHFLPGIAPYSCGVAAAPGYEIVHVTLRRPVGWRAGFDVVADFLAAQGRPHAAVCGMELRSPEPFTFAGFTAFNADYAAVLKSWNVFVDGINPVARTNVAPVVTPPPEPQLYGFSFTRPVAGPVPLTFVVAGGGELPEGKLDRPDIVALGDTTPQGLLTKAEFVMGLMETRLRALGADWNLATMIDIYTIHSLDQLLPRAVLERMRPADGGGVHWHYTRPPIVDIEYEMDLRGVNTELWI